MAKSADTAGLTRYIVFIDRAVEDCQSLAAGIDAAAEVITLNPSEDGVAQIGKILASRTGIDAIHIVSHGSAGCLQLGSQSLNTDNLETHSTALQQWGNSLKPDGEILLYGCEVAAGETGAAFVRNLSHLTKANVAASAKRIGSAEKGGHWKLEYTTGEVRSPLAFQPAVMAAYKHVLTSFSKPINFGGVSRPQYVAMSDFNGDSILDLAVPNRGVNTISIFLGNGNGSFNSSTYFATGQYPFWVTVGNFNADSFPDLAVANWGTSNVSVLLGNGAGSFSPASNFAVGTSPWSVASGDFNGDSYLDLATANTQGNNVSIMLGNGAGSFAAANNFSVGSTPQSVAVGDFNKDNKLDIVAANFSSNNVSVLLGNGAGSFGPAANFAVGSNPYTVATGDLNNDGILDIATANEASSNVSVLFGNGTGGFSAASNFAVGSKPRGVAISDLNVDGIPDLVTANGAVNDSPTNNLSILLGNGAGGFAAATHLNLGTGAWTVTAGDLNGDGLPDLATSNYWTHQISVLMNMGVKFGAATYSTAEETGDAVFNIPVILSGTPLANVTVPIAINPSSTAAAEDYTLSANSLTFAAGATGAALTQNIAVTVKADSLPEGDETVVLDFGAIAGAVPAAIAQTTLTIAANDTVDFAIAAGTPSIAEGNAAPQTLTFTVTRSGATDVASSVDYSIGGTATAGSDYSNIGGTSGATGTTGTINFAAGETSKTITLDVLGDALSEGSEEIAVTLSNPVAPVLTPTISTATAISAIENDDTPGIAINPTSGLNTTETGGTATFTVVLNSQPTADVTLGLSSSNSAEGTLSANSLTFTPTNWNQPQTVTVTGVDDAAKDGDIAYSIVTAAAASADANYSGMDAADVALTNTDNDTPGIAVNPTSGLSTTEAGGTATFTVVLNSQPTADVTLGLSSSNSAEGTLSANSLTFTAANWNQPQTVTVTGVDDAVKDGDIAYSIVTAATISADANYSGIDAADAALTNTDNDVAGIAINPTSGLSTTEAGGTATFTVVLNSQPTADVTLGLSSSNSAEGTLSANSLTFTAANWNQPQTVTVTGVDDAVKDGDIAYSIVTAAAVSTDANYSGIDAADVAVANTDNDVTPGITVNPTSGLNTTEIGGTATFTVVLNSQPTAEVTLGLSSSNSAEGTLSTNSLTFTAANWNQPQTVTVTGVDDTVDDDNIAYSIATAAAVSADANYSGMDAADVAVANTDNDTAGIRITPTSPLITTENGGIATLRLTLNSKPTADVTLNLSSSNEGEGTVSTKVLTFTPTNWNQPQTVTVTGVADSVLDGDVNYAVSAAATSTDPKYNLQQASVTLTNSSSLPTLNFSPFTYTVNEGRDVPVQAQVTLTRAGDLTKPSSVQISRIGGNATLGTDYNFAFSNPVIFNANETSKTLVFNILPDTRIEPLETANLGVTSLSNAAIGNQSTATLQIADPGASIINFSQPTYTVKENRKIPVQAQITFTRTGDLSASSSIAIKPIGGNAISGMDYNLPSSTVTFNANEASKTLTVDIRPDDIVEGTKEVSFQISRLSGSGIIGSQKTATLQIFDDPPAIIEFSQPTYSVKESRTARVETQITLKRSGDLSEASSVYIQPSGGTTSYWRDFEIYEPNVTFNPNEDTKTFNVSISPDSQIEGTENFNLALVYGNNARPGTLRTATLQILDNPPPTVEFSQPTYSVKESRTGQIQAAITLTRSGDISGSCTVEFSRPEGSATYGADYNLPSNLSFDANEASKTLIVDIAPDTTVEGTEEINLGISSVSDGSIGTQKTATLQILDAEPPTVEFSQEVYLAQENSTASLYKEITLKRTGDLSQPSSVEVSLIGWHPTYGLDTATYGQDIEVVQPFDRSVDFTAGEDTKKFWVRIFPDAQVEEAERASLVLFSRSNATVDFNRPASVEIFDSTSTVNRPPVLTNPIPDQFWSTFNGNFTLTLAANTFTDPDPGDSLTYSATRIVADDSFSTFPLPSGITFDPNTRTFTATTRNPINILIEVKATDRFGQTAADTFQLYSDGIQGIAIDGYIAGAAVFFDANKNGVQDANEPSTTTDNFGSYALDVPFDVFDTDKNGQIEPSEGQIVAFGGTDTATGLPLETPLVAPPYATVLTLLTSLVAELLDRGVEADEAEDLVKAALSLPAVADVTATDPIAAVSKGEPGGVELLAAMTKLQNFITQTAGLIDGASTATQNAIVETVVAAIASQIQAGVILDLSNADSLAAIIEIAVAGTKQLDPNLNAILSTQFIAAAAEVMAASNQAVDSVVANTPSESLHPEIAKVQKVTLDEVVKDLKEAAAGSKSIEDAIAEDTGTALEAQIRGISIENPTDGGSGIPFFPVIGGSVDLVNTSANQTFGTEGDDSLTGGSGDDTISAKQGKDTVIGGDGSDLLFGNSEDDFIDGNAGDDTVYGGKNNDTLLGSGGSDRLLGNLGSDNLSGGDGDDYLNGNQENDAIAGGDGNDTVHGGKNADVLQGNLGADVLCGDMGDDNLDGGDGDDTLYGNKGTDLLDGAEGNDSLFGGQENDTLSGGDGSDRLSGDKGSDFLTGGAGSDRFVLALGTGSDIVADFTDGEDAIALAGGLTFAQLTITSGDSGVLISAGGELLATLTGVSFTAIDQSDFTAL